MLNVTCLGCGCLCDDIRVEVEGNQIVETERACSMGRSWFQSARSNVAQPAATIDGQPSEIDPALDRAADILGSARAPFIWGLSSSTIEGVASALAIADRIGATVDIARDHAAIGRFEAFQRVGHVSSSLGEVKDRADVVVFWNVDPLKTHPRHWERYSVEPRGRFIPNGRAGRFVIVVDSQPSESSQKADLFVAIDRDRQPEALDVLRALVQGISLDPERACRSAGVPFAVLENLSGRLKDARYGAMFYEPSHDPRASTSRMTESLLKLVRDLNEGRRFVALEMGSPGNNGGASSVLTWQAGAPSSVDFSLGFPRHLPREATLQSRLDRGEVDAVLMVVENQWDALDTRHIDQLSQIPTILISPGNLFPAPTSVTIQSALTGIESGGTVARVDGVMLPLRPIIPTNLPSDRQILEAIRERLKSHGQKHQPQAQ